MLLWSGDRRYKMRNLTLNEIGFVSGAGEAPQQCDGSGDSMIGDQSTFGQNVIDAYEGAIAGAVYIAERVTDAIKDTEN
ncbi:MAG: hypothetical protein ACI9N9_001039 [Enterobacterales bacterium]|jgi:hypothetical protein